MEATIEKLRIAEEKRSITEETELEEINNRRNRAGGDQATKKNSRRTED